MAKERTFPLEFESRKPVFHYPDDPAAVVADVLEIGPGRGDMLVWLAQQFPDKRFVGIELMMRRFRRLIRKIERFGLTNVRLMRGNARIVIPRYFTVPSFERIYVLFPDPWPKERHAFHRLLSVDFLSCLATTLRDEGEIILATDHQPYADWVVANVQQVSGLQNMGSPYSSDQNLIPNPDRTYFERLWTAKGRTIYFVHIKKLGLPK